MLFDESTKHFYWIDLLSIWTVAKLAREQIQPLVSKMDEEHQFDPSVIKLLFDNGLMGVEADPEFGGSGYVSTLDKCYLDCVHTRKKNHVCLFPYTLDRTSYQLCLFVKSWAKWVVIETCSMSN